MAKVIAGMTMSLDGFVNDRNGSVERLYPDLEALRKTKVLAGKTTAVRIDRESLRLSTELFEQTARAFLSR